MDTNKEVNDFINALGGIAETLGEFHRDLLNQGFDEYQAIYLTCEFMHSIIMMPQRNEDRDDD